MSSLFCRICLISDVKMYNLKQMPLKVCLEFIPLLNNDPACFPHHVCYECAAILMKFSNFMQKSIKAQSILIQILEMYSEIPETSLHNINRQNLKLVSKLVTMPVLTESVIGHTENCIADIVKIEDTLKSHNEDNHMKSEQQEDINFDAKQRNTRNLKDKSNEEAIKAESDLSGEPRDIFDISTNSKKHTKRRIKPTAKRKSRLKLTQNRDNDSSDFYTEDEMAVDFKETAEEVVVEPLKNLKENLDNKFEKTNEINERTARQTRSRGKTKTSRSPKSKRKNAKESNKQNDFDVDRKQTRKTRFDEQILKCFEIVKLTFEEQVAELEQRKLSPGYLKARYKCEVCYKGFKKLDPFKHHMAEHDPSFGPHECAVCHKRFRAADTLARHVSTGHARAFRCRLCVAVCRERQTHIHMSSHEEMKYTFKCKHCDFETNTARGYYSHRRTHAARYDCARCGRAFISERGLALHTLRGHRDSHTLRETDESAAPSDGLTHACGECGARFTSAPALQVHRATSLKHVAASVSCARCGETFPSRVLLAAHRRQHHAAPPFPVKCEHCDEIISSGWQHWQHTRSKHPQQKQNYRSLLQHACLCEICGKEFPFKSQLSLHLARHGPAGRAVRCGCGAAFYDRQQLSVHRRTVHRALRPHACPHCPRAFKVKGDLLRHAPVHSGEKPFECAVCGARFTQSGSRALHVRTVHLRQPHPPRTRTRRAAPPAPSHLADNKPHLQT